MHDFTVEAENSVRKQLFADGTYGVMPKQAPVPAMSSGMSGVNN